MNQDIRIDQVVALMEGFVERTGIDGDPSRRRYLWTDAFAVCNFLGLARITGDDTHRERALRLIDGVHHTLGRQRPDSGQSGWLSGLGDVEGEQHPTAGGLRIGKPLPERRADEPYDERHEWDRDGQYFHYLTKWMHALDQTARHTGDVHYNTWARELAAVAVRRFVDRGPGPGGKILYWKMNVDLSRPLVSSMGQHDPLDGFLTCLQLTCTARLLGAEPTAPDLDEGIRLLASLVDPRALASADPLGIGGLLADAFRADQLARLGAAAPLNLLPALLDAARAGLEGYAAQGEYRRDARYRLGFRELGLAIGLHAVDRLKSERVSSPSQPDAAALEALSRYLAIAGAIESFWLSAEPQRTSTWLDHQDINEVMLATSLAPEGFLDIGPLS